MEPTIQCSSGSLFLKGNLKKLYISHHKVNACGRTVIFNGSLSGVNDLFYMLVPMKFYLLFFTVCFIESCIKLHGCCKMPHIALLTLVSTILFSNRAVH